MKEIKAFIHAHRIGNVIAALVGGNAMTGEHLETDAALRQVTHGVDEMA